MRNSRTGPLLAAVLLLAAVPLGSCAGPRPEPFSNPVQVRLEASDVVLPVEWEEDAILVSVTVDGAGPYSFLLDTGAAICMVSPRVAQGHPGGIRAMSLEFQGASGTGTLDRWIRIDSLRAGEAEWRGIDAGVLDLSLFSRILGHELDGILPFTAFAGGLLTIDYPAREVRFSSGALGPVDGVDVLSLVKGPLYYLPFLPVTVAGTEVGLLIDTGSNGHASLQALPEGARFATGSTWMSRSITATGLSELEEKGRLSTTLSFGRFTVRDPIIEVSKGPPIMGTRLLRHFRWTFDAMGPSVRIEGQVEGDLRPEALHGIGARLMPVPDGWCVGDVVPESPAARAGLRDGVRVVSIDGVRLGWMLPRGTLARLRRPGSTVRLGVLEDEVERTVEISSVVMIP